MLSVPSDLDGGEEGYFCVRDFVEGSSLSKVTFSSEVYGDEDVDGVVDDLYDGSLDGLYDGE